MDGSTSATSAAERAVVERARRLSVASSTPRDIVTSIEDAALERVDRNLARQFAELDRRFSRSSAAILSDSQRRDVSADAASDGRPPVSGTSFFDVAGMMLSIIAFAVVIAGSGRGSRAVIPFDSSALLAASGTIAAVVLHSLAALLANRALYRAPGTWKLILFSAASMWVAAVWLLVRQTALDEGGVLAMPAYLVLGFGGGIALMLALVNLRRWRRLLRSVEERRSGPELRGVDTALAELAESTRLDAAGRFERLPSAAQDQFDQLMTAGLAKIGGERESVAALRQRYRSAPRFSLRYDS